MSQMLALIFCAKLVLFLSILASCDAYAKGPPWKMCLQKIPKHGGRDAQTSEAPYEVLVSNTSYSPGDNITVTLKSKTAAVAFRGFVVGAHAIKGDTENVVGKFVEMPSDSKGLSWYAERLDEWNCVTHNSKNDRTKISFIWQAPGESVGDIHFLAAFSQDYYKFWANVPSPVVRSSTPGFPAFKSEVVLETKNIKSQDLIASCGVKYGCILYPIFCHGDDCEMIVTFKRVPSDTGPNIHMEMLALTPGYISFAVSDDRLMTDDYTISCTILKDGKYASVQNGYNPRYNNERHRIYNYTNVRVSYSRDRIYCSFERPLVIPIITLIENPAKTKATYTIKDFDLRIPRYAFLGIGGLYHMTDVMMKHTLEPIITTRKVNFLSKEIYYASTLPILVQLHASSMLIAWMVFAGLGMILAGNFKEIIIKMACGARLWFQLHRGVMLMTTVLALIGLFLILTYGWRERAGTHGIVGLTTLSLTAIQVLMGIARPDIDSKRRIIFNWAHFLFGYGIHIFATATIILAFMMPHLPTSMRMKNCLVVIVWIVMQVVWVVTFRVLRHVFRKRSAEAEISEKASEIQIQENTKPSKMESRVLFVALAVYILMMLLFFFVCVTYIIIY